MTANQSDPSIFYRYFYNRSIVVQEGRRLRERRRRRKSIIRQRAFAYDVHGCAEIAEHCTFPECFCYPYWKPKYREKIATRTIIIYGEEQNENETAD